MKGNGTFEDGELVSEGHIEEMAVKLQINIRVKQGQDSLQRFSANNFICGSHIGECALSEMLKFE